MIFTAVYVVWLFSELKVSKNEIRQGDQTSDYGTCEIYAMGQAGVFISALWLNPIWNKPNSFHILGFFLFVSGLLYRLWAIRTLGQYYSHIVRKVDGHRVVDTGPYKYIRHPAYAGMILANAGIVIYFLNTVTLIIYLIVFVPAIVLRILIEEKTLNKVEGYPEFAQTRKRILPSVW